MMTSYEYALHHWEEPGLVDALCMCSDREEIFVLVQCLLSKRNYHRTLESAKNAINEESRNYWLTSANKWSGWYLDELRRLEAMQ